MKLFLRIIVVSVLQSVVWSATLPAELLNWQMPQVKIQGTLKLTNGLTSASGTYNIESWHFKGSQIHILDSQKDSLRLVLYWIEDSSSFSYWSKGDDETFGTPMTDSVKAKQGSFVSSFSPLSMLNTSINQLKTAKDSDITLSANGSEGTVTIGGAAIPGQYYSQYSKTIFHYRDNRLLSRETFLSGENHQTGEKTAPFLGAQTVYSDYSSDFSSPIPMSCTMTNWLSSGKILILYDWHYHSVTPIADGETAKTVLSGATSGLTLDRWPARLHQNYPMNVQKKPLVTTFLVSLGIGLFAVLFLAWLWKRRRS